MSEEQWLFDSWICDGAMKAPPPQVSSPGLTRGSSLARTPSHKTRWMAGSSPAMTWGEAWDYCEARFALSGHNDREW